MSAEEIFFKADQLESRIWTNLPIYSDVNAKFGCGLDQDHPVHSCFAYKEGLYWCEREACDFMNIVSPRSFETKCVFCGCQNVLKEENLFQKRVERERFQQLLPSSFNPFLNFIRTEFLTEPNLEQLGVEIGLRVHSSGMRMRNSIVIRKVPFYNVRRGFGFGSLNKGMDNRFEIPPVNFGANSELERAVYIRRYMSKDSQPIVPIFEDTSFLLGPQTEYPTFFDLKPWPEN